MKDLGTLDSIVNDKARVVQDLFDGLYIAKDRNINRTCILVVHKGAWHTYYRDGSSREFDFYSREYLDVLGKFSNQ